MNHYNEDWFLAFDAQYPMTEGVIYIGCIDSVMSHRVEMDNGLWLEGFRRCDNLGGGTYTVVEK